MLKDLLAALQVQASPSKSEQVRPNKGVFAQVFLRKIAIHVLSQAGDATLCPIRWIDNFAMRNFTNDAIFDDTLPIGDGLLEIGLLVPLEELKPAMENWFRRKGYLRAGEVLVLEEKVGARPGPEE